jgi:small subunit ribosomal protein S6
VRRDYELGFILNPEVSEEQSHAMLERVEQIVSNYDGQVVRVNQWGRRRLAYPIQHHRDGYYVFFDMTLTPETVLELDRTMKVSEEVLRHLIKRRDPITVQKERETRAAAAAQAPAPATPSTEAESEAVPEVPAEPGAEPEAVEVPTEPGAEPEAVEVPTGEEEEAPIVLSPEEIEYVPPAIEEEENIEV